MRTPAEADLRARLPRVRDQGLLRGTCLAFAATTAHETRRRGEGDDEDLSTEALFWAAKEDEGNRDDGTTLPAIANALVTHGQPPESAWPYEPLRDISDGCYQRPEAATDPVVLRRARLTPIVATVDAIKSELAAGNVVIAGIELWEDFELLNEGELALPDRVALNGSYHAVAFVGFSEREGRVLLRNSWGEDWGDGGYAWLPYEFVSEFVLIAAALDSLLPMP